MATQTISQEMLSYFGLLNEAEKKSVLDLIKTFLGNRKNESLNQTLHEYNMELEQADKEIEAGKYTSHEEVTNRYSSK